MHSLYFRVPLYFSAVFFSLHWLLLLFGIKLSNDFGSVFLAVIVIWYLVNPNFHLGDDSFPIFELPDITGTPSNFFEYCGDIYGPSIPCGVVGFLYGLLYVARVAQKPSGTRIAIHYLIATISVLIVFILMGIYGSGLSSC